MLESPYDLGSGEAEELVANNVVLMVGYGAKPFGLFGCQTTHHPNAVDPSRRVE